MSSFESSFPSPVEPLLVVSMHKICLALLGIAYMVPLTSTPPWNLFFSSLTFPKVVATSCSVSILRKKLRNQQDEGNVNKRKDQKDGIRTTITS